MPLLMPQMLQIVAKTIGNINLCHIFCGRHQFALWQESTGSPELPVLSSYPRQVFLGFQEPDFVCPGNSTAGVFPRRQDWTPEGLGTPAFLSSLLAGVYPRNPPAWNFLGSHISLPCPNLWHITTNGKILGRLLWGFKDPHL